MDTSNSTLFDWLRDECAQIQSRKFHIFDLVMEDCAHTGSNRVEALAQCDFAKFLIEFGHARFFTDHNDAPQLSVYQLDESRIIRDDNGKEFIGFGFRGSSSYYFDRQRICNDGVSTVFLHKGKRIEHCHDSFSIWLAYSYKVIKEKYSARKWREVVSGPKPFTDQEKLIVEARASFRWALTGFKSDGLAIFRVENRSSINLPFFTIGVRDRNRRILEGGVWLNTSHIKPGEFADIEADCYKGQIPSNELVVFESPEPIPEKRNAYWEFGIPK